MSKRDEIDGLNFIESDCASIAVFYKSSLENEIKKDEKYFYTLCASSKLSAVLKEVCEQDATLIALKNVIF